ncbi:TonB-dependent receptor plug domain-containing protein [Dyella amyloliquefaciens]|uniref:TonB-dependent receptor plug domain-containing protein n=1 Tax=Dyella amyloliquefaciens TaxID=1770545 RepID=UPI003CE48237
MLNKQIALSPRALSAALATLFALGAAPAFAQSTTGSIFGQVPAANGETVQIKSATGITRTVAVDDRRRYVASELPLGTYTVSLLRDGNVVDTRNDISLRVGAGTEVSFEAAAAKELGAVSVSASTTPQIDVTSVDSRTVITAQELARLPLARSAEAIALLAPGVTGNSGGYTGPTGQSLVTFGGSAASENAYYINGFNTTESQRGLGGLTLPYGAIEQQEIYTGGYSAQYGRSDGGVINMVGKRGTNEWHFGGQVLWEPAFAQADARDTYYTNGLPASPIAGGLYDPNSRNRQWTTTVDAYVGGPLIKDKLFLFVAAEAERQEGDAVNNVSSAKPYVDYRYTTPKWYAKLDWNITDSNILEVTGASSKRSTSGSIYDYDYSALSRDAYINANDNTKTGGDLYTAKFTSYITDRLTFSALYGKMKTVNYDVPGNYDGSLTYLTDIQNQNPAFNGGNPIGNSQVTQSLFNPNRHNDSNNLRIDLSYQLGSHTLSAGIDNQNARAIDQGSQNSGPGYYWQYAYTTTPNVALIPNLGVGAPANYPNGANGYYAIQYVNSSIASVRSAQRAQYIEDKWQVTDRWLLSLGLRNDQFTDYNANGEAYIRQRSAQWAPRLGFTWDVNGDSSFKVYGNAGRYYLGLPLNPALNAAGAYVATQQYFTYSGIAADGTPIGLVPFSNPVSPNNTYGVLPDPKTVTAQDIKPEYQDEFILGFDKTLGSNWTYGAKLTQRILRTGIDDYCDVPAIENKAAQLGYTVSATNSCYLINPGRANTFTVVDDGGAYRSVSLSNAEMGFPPLKRKYYALETYLEHPFDGHWYGKIDYVFSRSYGDTEGQLRSDIQQTAASTSIDWDFPALMSYSNGAQSNDHAHQIKLFGYYQITPEWQVSGNLSIVSGNPRNCLGYYGPNQTDPDGYGSYYHWCGGQPSPPGTHRLPWNKQLDLGATYRPAFAEGKLGFSLNVFNVFNSQAILNAYPYYQISPGTPDPLYGSAVVRQQPRYLRLAATYDY